MFTKKPFVRRTGFMYIDALPGRYQEKLFVAWLRYVDSRNEGYLRSVSISNIHTQIDEMLQEIKEENAPKKKPAPLLERIKMVDVVFPSGEYFLFHLCPDCFGSRAKTPRPLSEFNNAAEGSKCDFCDKVL